MRSGTRAGPNELTKLVDRGLLRPPVHCTFCLHEIRAAHERFPHGGLAGKIAVTS